MNEIIKNIEAEQLKKDVPQFNVGDTVRVHAPTFRLFFCIKTPIYTSV